MKKRKMRVPKGTGYRSEGGTKKTGKLSCIDTPHGNGPPSFKKGGKHSGAKY